jgi:hypothetical protein
MANYHAEVLWTRGSQAFLDNRYSRRHLLRFDGEIEVPGSSSPHVVPLPLSDAAAIDPEEAMIDDWLSFNAGTALRLFRPTPGSGEPSYGLSR